ncbi:MAG: TetR/AcrR family transcriptional regulator [Thermoleophilaceae bacterium]|nr:TetR/AcrR family transcriptional regulator [Thermoleophilaceae bacterium]
MTQPTETKAARRRTQAERRAGTRESLAAAAAACLVEDGMAGFKTARVTARAGFSEGTLFRYYANKEELIAATMERVFLEMVAEHNGQFRDLDPADMNPALVVESLWDLLDDQRVLSIVEVKAYARLDEKLAVAIKPVLARQREITFDYVRSLMKGHPLTTLPIFAAATEAMVMATEAMLLSQVSVRNPAHVDALKQYFAFILTIGFDAELLRALVNSAQSHSGGETLT